MSFLSYILIGMSILLLISFSLFAWRICAPPIQVHGYRHNMVVFHTRYGSGFVLCPGCWQPVCLNCAHSVYTDMWQNQAHRVLHPVWGCGI
jgi:hypothetical protein